MITKKSIKKNSRIVIRCTPETKNRLRVFCAKKSFKNFEDAINWLLTKAENEW